MVVQYWHDSSALPRDVRNCIASWQALRSLGFEHHVFCDFEASTFIQQHFGSAEADAFKRCHHPAMRCDFFRLCYLYEYGGAYVDADEVYRQGLDALFQTDRLKLQPLCYDLGTESMVPSSEFLDASAATANRTYYVNNNPLIGPSRHPLIKAAIERATGLLLESEVPQVIQETTGPGNLSASLVKHARFLADEKSDWDFEIVSNWEEIAECRWHLSYRKDERNWRIAEEMRRRVPLSNASQKIS